MDYFRCATMRRGELYQKLCRRFDAHSAAYAVARAGELGLLNDAGFAPAARPSCCASASPAGKS